MRRLLLSFISVLAIIFIVPFLVYSLFTIYTPLKAPEVVSPLIFLASVFISKVGTAAAFVLIFYYTRIALVDRWRTYASIWWLMFAFGEMGQAVGPEYSWLEAAAGIISETIYFPVSAYLTDKLIGIK